MTAARGVTGGVMVRLAVLVLASLLVIGVPMANAGNWGAAKTKESLAIFCTGESTNKSECTPQDFYQYFFISGVWPFTDQTLEDEFNDSRLNDFDALTGVIGALTTNTSTADVFVYQRTTNVFWDMAYTTCSNGATYGYEDIRYYMWCDPQLLFFQDDSSAYTQCWNDYNCVRHFMCHEIGHTYGLQHNGRNTSCMEDDITQDVYVLDAHDKDHLYDCIPRPSEASLPTFPADGRTTLCRDFE
jgi:hypothetical protein